MTIKLTQSQIAAALQVDKALVSRYKGMGMPVDSIEAARAWKDANIRARIQDRPPADVGTPAAPASAAPPDYWLERARREQAEAAIAELRRGEMQGELIRVSAVRAAMTNAYVTAREGILNIPARLAPQLAAESDPAVVQELLQAELHGVLTALAGAPGAIGQDPPQT